MAYKDVYKMSNEEVRNLIFKELDCPDRLRRKALIEKVIIALGFSQEEINDRRTGSQVVRAKSRIGMVLSGCMKSGYISESEIGYLSLIGCGSLKVSREMLRDFVISQLEQKSGMSKNELVSAAEIKYGADKTVCDKDNNELRNSICKVIERLEIEKHILRSGNGYRTATDRKYPNTELGSALRSAAHGGNLKECFLEAVHTMGGEWFEIFAVELLANYYKTSGKTVITASVMGGSDDGGIDGIIDTEDWLGYREHILMQMKNRYAVMNPKDLREFYGAVCADNGSRGVFITISRFHEQAWKFIQKVDNLTGIDGDKLFEIACKSGIGLIKVNGKFVIDEDLFLKEELK